MPILEATISDAAVREKELEGYVTALLAKRREMQGELLAFREARRAEAVNVTEGAGGGQVGAKVRAAESAFDRTLSRQAGLPGMRSAADAKTAAQLAELENLSRVNRVEERLAQLKATRSTKE
jgi:phage shock protein A